MAVIHPSIRTERFEVDQYVRAELPGGRAEIGVVVSLDEPGERAVIATLNGYEINVHLRSVRRAFLLVLDLNGVLVARGRGTFVGRPGVVEFVQFVMNNFVVAVWTSGLERTSTPIIEKIFDNFQDRLLFKFYRDQCAERPTPENSYRTIKNLQRIFDAYPKSFHAVNTIIVDDSPDKCSHPDIALCPVPFNDPVKQVNDNGLALAMAVLKEVLRVESNAPLIRASEERLAALAAREGQEGKEKKAAAPEEGEEQHQQEYLDNSKDNAVGLPTNMKVISMYDKNMKREERHGAATEKMRLCRDYSSGNCARERCRFSHGADDGKRPGSKKNFSLPDHARRSSDRPGHQVTVVGTTTSEYRKGRSDPVSFDVSKIVSLFSTNPDQQKQPQHRQYQENPPGYNAPRQERPKSTQQYQDRRPDLKREKYKAGYKQDGRPNDVKDSGRPWEGRKLPHGNGIDLKFSGATKPSFVDKVLPRDAPATRTATTTTNASVSVPVARHFMGDTRDGGALLRNLQASLMGQANKLDSDTSGELSKWKDKR